MTGPFRVLHIIRKRKVVLLVGNKLISSASYEGCKAVMKQIRKSIQLLNFSISNIYEHLDSFYKSTELLFIKLQEIYSSKLSDEEKERIRDSYRSWGKYGWTQPFSAPVVFLDIPPIDRKDADAKAMKYCTDEDIEQLFNSLLDLSYIKEPDVYEAISAYKSGYYKSCVLILFSLIDALLICLQRDEDRKGKDLYRKSGSGAARNFFRHIKEENDICNDPFTLFFHENLFSCILAMFENGDDFNIQPDKINRNFLSHGMLAREVSRKDCMQVFLLYYNFLDYLDWYEDLLAKFPGISAS